MNNLKNLVDQILSWTIILVSVLLVSCVVWQVFSRYCLGIPSITTDEVARFLFMWVGLLGAAYGVSLKRHLAIDFLTQKLTGKKRLINEIVILLTMIFFASLVMIYGGGGLVQKTLASQQISPSLGIPMGLVYLAIPFSGAVIVFYLCIDFINKITNNSND